MVTDGHHQPSSPKFNGHDHLYYEIVFDLDLILYPFFCLLRVVTKVRICFRVETYTHYTIDNILSCIGTGWNLRGLSHVTGQKLDE